MTAPVVRARQEELAVTAPMGVTAAPVPREQLAGPATYDLVGEVILTSYEFDTGAPFSTVQARFGQLCESTSVEDCVVVSCTPSGAPVDAGVITVSGGVQTATMTPEAGAYTADLDTELNLFLSGQTLTIEAAGGTCPAFTASVDAPMLGAFNLPAMIASGVTHNANEDLLFNNVNETAKAEFVFTTADETVTITCGLASTAVPSAAFDSLTETVTGTLTVFTEATVEPSPGEGWSVVVRARNIWHQSMLFPATGEFTLTVP